jgi:hypothetical protein
VAVFAEAALNRGCTHQVNRRGGDYLNRWHLGDVSNLIGNVAKFC